MSSPEQTLMVPPAGTITSASCCAETVNSAISMWTELEVVDEDEDLYTYLTLDTASAQQQQQERNRMLSQPFAGGLRGCLRTTTPKLHPSSSRICEDASSMMDVEVDPKIQWQEEAYWMSFQNAVRSFSDHQASRSSSGTSNYVAAPGAMTMMRSARDGGGGDDDDTEMSSFHCLYPHVLTSTGDDNYDDVVDEDDGIPPCIPRTVVTPTASLGSSHAPTSSGRQMMNVGSSDHQHQRSGSMSIATATSSSGGSSSSTTRRMTKLPNFSSSQYHQASERPTPPVASPPSPRQPQQQSQPPQPENGQYAEIRRSLRELMAQAALNRKSGGGAGPQCPNSPPRNASSNTNNPPPLRRGDPGFAISSSLAGPNLEEIKGLRWKMKELAEHAAVVAKGEKDAERYVIGASASNSVL